MTTISDLLTIIIVLVDDLYKVYGPKSPAGKPTAKLELSDNEVVTLMLAHYSFPNRAKSSILGLFAPIIWIYFPSYWIRANSTAGHV